MQNVYVYIQEGVPAGSGEFKPDKPSEKDGGRWNIKALSMKQEPHKLQLWEMSARHSMILYISTKITTRNTVPMAAYMPFSEVL